MKKYIIIAVLLLGVTAQPAVASAAWWNPLSWFRANESVRVLDDDKKEDGVSTATSGSATSFTTSTSATSTESKGESVSAYPKTVTLAVGETVKVLGVKAKVMEVTEDSRCPAGVMCITAGTVKVSVKASYAFFGKTISFTLGQPYEFRGHTITLTEVAPLKKADAIAPADYRFTFTLDVLKSDNKSDESDNDKSSKDGSVKENDDNRGDSKPDIRKPEQRKEEMSQGVKTEREDDDSEDEDQNDR